MVDYLRLGGWSGTGYQVVGVGVRYKDKPVWRLECRRLLSEIYKNLRVH